MNSFWVGILTAALWMGAGLWWIGRMDKAARRRKRQLLDKIRCTKRVYHRTEDGTAFKEE
jgi:hypothetical protein